MLAYTLPLLAISIFKDAEHNDGGRPNHIDAQIAAPNVYRQRSVVLTFNDLPLVLVC